MAESVELTSKYDLGAELGRGAFSTVKLATSKKTKEKVAVKIIDKKMLGKIMRKI